MTQRMLINAVANANNASGKALSSSRVAAAVVAVVLVAKKRE